MAFETSLVNAVITITFSLVALISVFIVYSILREKNEDYRWIYILLGVALMGTGIGLRILEFIFNSELVTLIRMISYLGAAIIFLGIFRKPAKKNKLFDG